MEETSGLNADKSHHGCFLWCSHHLDVNPEISPAAATMVDNENGIVKKWFQYFCFNTDDVRALTGETTPSTGQQPVQDWSVICECFDKPYSLMYASNTMSKVMNDIVANAVTEMRRLYSRKIVDILARVTRQSVDELRRKFSPMSGKILMNFL